MLNVSCAPVRSGTDRRLTGTGPRSQRGLESPGAEVGRCSLKDEGDRQGDKHGPLSTWGSFLGFTVVALFFSYSWSSRRSSAFLRTLVDSRVCGCWTAANGEWGCGVFFREPSLRVAGLTCLYLWILHSCGKHTDSGTHTDAQRRGFGRINKAIGGYPRRLTQAAGHC